MELKWQREWRAASGGEEVVGVHRDDSLERFGCEGKVKNSDVVGDGRRHEGRLILGKEDM